VRRLTYVAAIVSLRDIARLSSKQEEDITPSVSVLNKKEVDDVLRSIKDFNGHEVFAEATISSIKGDHSQIFNSQTFVERDKSAGTDRDG
jgi:hypothetical protein